MPREEWTDFTESMDAFWIDSPRFDVMPIEDRELWHQFAAAAEQHEMCRLIHVARGQHREAFRKVVRP